MMIDRSKTVIVDPNELKKKVAIAIVTDLIAQTPVDSSKALSNWVIGLGAPNRDKLDPYFFGDRGSTQETSGAVALSVARATIARAAPGQPIFISNNLPYIRRLNDGHSTQAPAGFVERAELIGGKIIRNER